MHVLAGGLKVPILCVGVAPITLQICTRTYSVQCTLYTQRWPAPQILRVYFAKISGIIEKFCRVRLTLQSCIPLPYIGYFKQDGI